MDQRIGCGDQCDPNFDFHYELCRGTYLPNRQFLASMLAFKPEKFKCLNKKVRDEMTDFLRLGMTIAKMQKMAAIQHGRMDEKDNCIGQLKRDKASVQQELNRLTNLLKLWKSHLRKKTRNWCNSNSLWRKRTGILKEKPMNLQTSTHIWRHCATTRHSSSTTRGITEISLGYRGRETTLTVTGTITVVDIKTNMEEEVLETHEPLTSVHWTQWNENIYIIIT